MNNIKQNSNSGNCKQCGQHTDKLVGLFVPHLCVSCLDKEREADIKAGRICRLCHKPYCDCCC